ncbi:unnamed protein product [Parascedosporium putredinis]|uniref:von Willebrand domain-containing protein n=1 Tax=Parascedosporium putredinis TaxID=1442378 RepID=A0A9P1H265_9PEZI|nr:unnamed protein product [Parascedosporium putredinis]CAI7993692.1 unnamed protein product [Parascedosporium putredinis]
MDAHVSILSSVSRTTLTQTFTTEGLSSALTEVKYAFPIYDGVSVVAFTCTIGDRVARDRGEAAALLEQVPEAADVWTTSVGNIPANTNVKVEISYLGELKHDAEVDGIRYTIPAVIAPRYGQMPESMLSTNSSLGGKGGLKIVVDAQVPAALAAKASATLTSGSTEFEKDFVLHVIATNTSNPVALLENHPTLPNQRALMATLVPRFNLPPDKPEIVFVCDRSGSMGWGKIENLKAALHIFLKSLPVGVKFNICSFGSSYSLLWDRSKSYDKSSLDEASRHIDTFDSNMGGTEMCQPIKAVFEKRYKDMNLEVFLLTDGDIWDQDKLFGIINSEVASSKGAIRVFTLGIGTGASTLEIKYAESKGDDKPQAEEGDDADDFELVEKVLDCLVVDDSRSEKTLVSGESETAKKKPEPETPPASSGTDAKFDHLPPSRSPSSSKPPSRSPLFPFNRTSVYVLMSDETARRPVKSVVLRGTSVHGALELEIPVTTLDEPGETVHQLAARKAVKELEEGKGWIRHAKDAGDELLSRRYDGRFSDMVEREAVRLGVRYQVAGRWCSFVAVEERPGEEAARQLSAPKEGEEGSAASEEEAVLESYAVAPAFQAQRSRKGAWAAWWAWRGACLFGAAPPAPGGSAQVESVALRGYAMDSLADKSNDLAAQSALFAQSSKAAAPPSLTDKAFSLFGSKKKRSGDPPPVTASSFSSMEKKKESSGFGGGGGSAGFRTSTTSAFGGHLAALDSGRPPPLLLAGRPAALDSVVLPGTRALPDPALAREPNPAAAFGQMHHRANLSASARSHGAHAVAAVVPTPVAQDPMTAIVDLQTFEGFWPAASAGELLAALGGTSDEKIVAALEASTATWAAALKGNADARLTAFVLVYLAKKLGSERDVWDMMAEKALDWLRGWWVVWSRMSWRGFGGFCK